MHLPKHRDRIGGKLIQMARYGMFHITNHGIRDRVITNALTPTKMFFDLPTHKLKRGAKFRDDVSQFASALEGLANKLIRLISKGLKLDESYFHDHGLSQGRRLNVNRYPRCPNLKLTCGLAKHCDPDLLTITFVEAGDAAHGLEVCIDNEWKRVVPRDDALIVTIGSQMWVVSNKKLKAPVHRVIVNSRWDRTFICYAVAPRNDSDGEPAEVLTRTESPRYRKYKYGDYLLNHLGHYRDTTVVLPSYEIRTWL